MTFTREEWIATARMVLPGLTEAQYMALWGSYVEGK